MMLRTEHSFFRKRCRQPSPEEVALHDTIKDEANELARLIARVPCTYPVGYDVPKDLPENMATNRSANVTLALRHVDDAVYRTVKALTTEETRHGG
jgi:hypothetical protein